MAIVANFGRSNFSTSSGGGSTPTDYAHVVYSATKVGDTTDSTFTIEEGGMYMLYSTEWTTSTGVIRGTGFYRIIGQLSPKYGTAAVHHTTINGTTDRGVTFTWNTDGTVSWKCSATTYTVTVVLIKYN